MPARCRRANAPMPCPARAPTFIPRPRPRAPASHAGATRRDSRLVELTADMQRVVLEQSLGFVATVTADGRPNLSPKGTTTVLDERHLMFADIASPRTVENLATNPSVEVNVVDPIVRKGFRFKGTARILEEGELFEQIVTFYRRAGSTSPIRAVVLIRVERALQLTSPAYDSGASEESIRARWETYYGEVRTRAVEASGRPRG